MKKLNEEEHVSKWKRLVVWAEAYQEPFRKGWKLATDFYENDFTKEDAATIPVVYQKRFVLLPLLNQGKPKYKIKAKNEDGMDKTDFTEKILEDILETSGYTHERSQVSLSGVITNFAVVKLGPFFIARQKIDEEEQVVFDEETGEEIDSGLEEDGVFARYIKNEDALFDPEGMFLESCRWVAHRIRMTKEDFEFNFGAKIEIAPTSMETIAADTMQYEQGNMSEFVDSEETKRIVLYEIFDKEHLKYYLIAKGYDKFLHIKGTGKSHKWPHELKDYPFVVLNLSPKLNSIYPINEVAMVQDVLKSKDSTEDKKRDSASKAKSLNVYEDGVFSEDSESALKEAENGQWIKANTGGVSRGGIKTITTPPPPAEVFQSAAEDDANLDKTWHISAEQQVGQQSTQGDKTATQARIEAGAGNMVNAYRVEQIDLFHEEMGRKLIALAKQYVSVKKMLRIEGKNGQGTTFRAWNGADIGQYTFKVKSGSSAFRDDTITANLAKEMLGLLMPLMQSKNPIPDFNPLPLLKEVLIKAFDALNVSNDSIEEAFEPQQQGAALPGASPATAVNRPAAAGDVPAPGEGGAATIEKILQMAGQNQGGSFNG